MRDSGGSRMKLADAIARSESARKPGSSSPQLPFISPWPRSSVSRSSGTQMGQPQWE